jgi:type IV fimbrial biogenesis protein FimT
MNTTLPVRRRGFSLIELLVVIGIIALIAGLAAPSFKNLRGGSVVRIATQQLSSDLSLARLKAITERTTVYMVFLDTNVVSSDPTGLTTAQLKQRENLMGGQYTAYNLFVERGVGDQPGSTHPRYLTEWRYLPDGMFIAQSKFTNYAAMNNPYSRSFRRDRAFPFPDEFGNTLNMPYIAFGPTGELVRDPLVAGDRDEIIPLAQGSVFNLFNTNGTYAIAPAQVTEIPPNNSVSNWNRIRINWLTGRTRVERPELP